MKQIRDKVGGLDVHRDSVVACTRVQAPDGSVEVAKERFSTTQKGLAALSGFLLDAGVRTVAMEATGIYWRPVYYALEGLFDELWLCNAQHVKNVPGRKSDLSDAEWLADVAAHGMVRPSLVPPPEIRGLRELTRYRKTQVDARSKEIQRLEKVLQDAGFKLTSVASTVWSKSSRAMIEAVLSGERDSVVLADLSKGVMRKKIPELEEALEANFNTHHVFLLSQIIEHLDYLDSAIESLNAEICARLVPFEAQMTLLTSIIAISQATAEVFIAETGGDMAKFPTPENLSSWTGLAPASYESAGKRRPAATKRGSPYLRRAFIEAARAAARTKGSYFSAQYQRIARRRGPNKAAIAVAHSMIVACWYVLTTGSLYQDPGADYFERRHDPAREAKRLQRRIEALGFTVTLTDRAA